MKKNIFQILFKKYKYEFISLVVNITAAFFAFSFKKDDQQNIAFWGSIGTFILSILVIIYLRTREKDFYYLPLNKHGDEKDWSGRGKFFYLRNERSFEITESGVGYIFPKTLIWDDYIFAFDFKIINKCLAWIVRANNLSNYIMLQCNFDGVNPHIRLDGQWIVKSHDDADVNLSFDEKLSPDTWYRAIIICEKRNIRISVYDKNKPIFDRHWVLPDQMIALYPTSLDPKDPKPIRIVQNIDFDLGAVGFRNDSDEKGLIKNIYVEKL